MRGGPADETRISEPAPGSVAVMEERRAGFTLDLARCVGCGACVLACRMENRLPASVSWRRILQVNRPRIDGGPTYHLSVACHHCHHPPCVHACPSGALDQRPDGLVLLDSDRCIGCRYCEMACPFGAPAFDPTAGVMTKCHLCHQRLAEGMDPACVASCPTEALGYVHGDAGPPDDGAGEARPAMADAARELPGFGDPASARPSFWVAPPAGARRAQWFRELKNMLGYGEGGSHGGA